jgi:putative glutathione S-transferase
MSLMMNGKLQKDWLASETEAGKFVRKESQFRNWITVDGSPGPSGSGGFTAQPDRYHLYVSLACPWAHRTLIFRKLKELEDLITVSVVHPHMGDAGWQFADFSGSTPDMLFGFDYLHQVYTQAQADYTGIVTVPVLWDKQQQTIVNNESSEIIRMFNSAFDQITGNDADYYPAPLRPEIDIINQMVYDSVNDGVYRCGFATTQVAYEESFDRLFAGLDELEQRLAAQRYLVGNRITEADWRLLTTLLRFDPVYYSHFKCNLRRIIDYPNLFGYLCDLYQRPAVIETFDINQVKHHYYTSHDFLNPSGIVPKGPALNYDLPHDRDRLS